MPNDVESAQSNLQKLMAKMESIDGSKSESKDSKPKKNNKKEAKQPNKNDGKKTAPGNKDKGDGKKNKPQKQQKPAPSPSKPKEEPKPSKKRKLELSTEQRDGKGGDKKKTNKPAADGNTSLQSKMKKSLSGARFRYVGISATAISNRCSQMDQ